MQKTDFPIEALIHDDASTDGTADIIREYEQKYPEIIKPIYQTENQYSKGVDVSTIYNFSRAQGKYIALCEGDDYWTDPYKLQKQVAVLEGNDKISCVYTKFQSVDTMSNNIHYPPALTYYKRSKSGDIFVDLLKGNFILTLTVCFRKTDIPYFFYESTVSMIDYLLFLCLSSKKQFHYIDDITGCYRINPKGMMCSQRKYVEYLCHETAKYIMYLFLVKKIQRKGIYKNGKIFLRIILFIYSQGIINYNRDVLKLLKYSWQLVFLLVTLLPIYIVYKIIKMIYHQFMPI
jgi:glycosyltransferase involved in cell wall biosynthesis